MFLWPTDASGPVAADSSGVAAPVEPLFDGSEARIPDTDDDAEEKEMRTKKKEEESDTKKKNRKAKTRQEDRESKEKKR